ncbi:MAG: hypothetical protein F6K48_31040 [Okeania sp. SIO3H1]|nr:hypothetical protein [Okeania sp. SIO3H1]NET24478.1 hypothetical protein [Okeania sp. SIO1I7]
MAAPRATALQGDEKAVDLRSAPVGWDSEETCAISNRPRENKVQYFKPLTFLRNAAQTGRGTEVRSCSTGG